MCVSLVSARVGGDKAAALNILDAMVKDLIPFHYQFGSVCLYALQTWIVKW